MVSFYINGVQADIQLENEKTIGDILTPFAKYCDDNDSAVIGIVVDGKTVTAEDFEKTSALPLGSDTKFEFSVVTKKEIHESFEKLAGLFEELSTKMEDVPVSLQSGKTKEVSESIKTVAESIDQFCHVAALASLFPQDFGNAQIDGKNFTEFFNEFAPVLKDFELALQNNDTVLIGDLSEYEICPRLKAISQSLQKLV
ncbi:MAG: hypothetical protein IK102_06645 [Treponema sp.]|nr:hypothetical protein [Treponema sp.]